MKFRYLFLILVALILAGAGCKTEKPPTVTELLTNPVVEKEEPEITKEPEKLEIIPRSPGILPKDQIANKVAVIKTKNGNIVINLLADEAPLAVSNFISLTKKSFYNGLAFHRVEPGFVVQGGDPRGDGTGGPGYAFADEPVTRDYLEGVVAMANSGPNTNGSQFFIILKDTPQLPKNYTIFGQVIYGMDAVKAISAGDKMEEVTIENAQ
jgi:cyclophilin family peptidyl-prolyl cis-trans isomerase